MQCFGGMTYHAPVSHSLSASAFDLLAAGGGDGGEFSKPIVYNLAFLILTSKPTYKPINGVRSTSTLDPPDDAASPLSYRIGTSVALCVSGMERPIRSSRASS